MTAPVMSEGFASGTSTLVMIWNRGVPIASAASITPLSTSLMEDSTMRATYGAAAITSVTITALLPSDVPTMNFATGSMATMRMMNGTLRKALMRMLRITSIVEDYGISKYAPVIATLLKNPTLILLQ